VKTPATPFVCRRCGACCRAAGEARLARGEPALLAKTLGLSEATFLADCTRLTRDRRGLALNERADGACIFLEPDNLCRVQQVKPQQCRDYPLRWRSGSLDAACRAQRSAGEDHVD
jgi:uncharacterized protein